MSRNPKVYFDITINKKPQNRITIELFSGTTPKTANHFLSLCTGNNPTRVSYKNSTFHRVLPGLCQGGAIEKVPFVRNGEKAENFIRKHDGAGTVSMVTPGGTQFFILTTCSPAHDGGYVVVGRVLDGMSVVNHVQSVGSLAGKTSVPVVIVDCGQIWEELKPVALGKSLKPVVIIDCDEDEEHVKMSSGLSLISVATPSSGEEITTSGMPRRGRGRPPGSWRRQRLARIGKNRKELALAASQKTSTPDEVIDCDELQEHANMGLELSLSSVTTPSSGEGITTSGMPCSGRGRPPGSGWRQKLARVASLKEQEIKCTDHVGMNLESSLVSVPAPSSGEELTTTFPTMPKNPKAYLDITINNQLTGRITIELFADTTPQTANHFLSLCTGNNPTRLHYKGSTFHRVLPSICQAGKIHSHSGKAEAENFIRKHDGPGTVSMVSPRGPQFFILTTSSPTHDGKYVVVGRVVQGLEVVDAVQTVGSSDGKTTMPVVIVDCGQLREELAPALEKSSMTPVEVIDCNEVQEDLAPALEKSSTTPVEVIDCDEVQEELALKTSTLDEVIDCVCDELQEHANMCLEASLVSVDTPSSGEEITTSGMPSRGSPPGSGLRLKLAPVASQQEEEIKRGNHANMGLESSIVSAPTPSSGEKITTGGMTLKGRSRGRLPGSGWRQNPIRIASQQEQKISTSDEQLSNSLKEIIDVTTQSIAVDAKDVLVLESEKDLVEVSVVSEHNLNALLGLKAGVCSLEKHQNKLLSHTRTQVPSIKKKKRTINMPKNKKSKNASLAKHVETLSLNSGRQVVRKCFQCESPKTLDSEAPRPSSWGEIIHGGTPSRACQKMSYEEFEQVIATSNRQLSDSLKEIMNVNKKLIAVDAKDVHVLESETESVEDVLEHNRNVLLDLKAEVSSLEKRQMELLSQTRTKISEIKNKKLVLEMIPSLSYEDLVNVEDMIKKRKIECR